MRELGVLEWDGIRLDPAWREPPPEVRKQEPEPDLGERHERYWRRVVRSSGASVPPCNKHCPCGGWREHGDAGLGRKVG